MAFSNELANAGFTPTSVHTTARVHFNPGPGGFAINSIDLETVGIVPGVDDATFQQIGQKAKENCPVSKVFVAGTREVELSLLDVSQSEDEEH